MSSNKTPPLKTGVDPRTSPRGKFKGFKATHSCKQGGNRRLAQVMRTYKSGVWHCAEVVFSNGSTARVYTNQLIELHPGVPARGDDGKPKIAVGIGMREKGT